MAETEKPAISRANHSGICSTDEIKPSFGYCAAHFGYKLHAVCDKNGIFYSFDFSPTNVHEVNYLNDIKEHFQDCLLIGDRGCISKEFLRVFQEQNQKSENGLKPTISQLWGQFTININLIHLKKSLQ